METQGLEVLTDRFASWNNLSSATAVLEKEQKGSQYDCNWCNSGCGGCAGCSGADYSPQTKEKMAVPEMRGIEARASYECQGCTGCNGCDSCE